MDAEEPGRRKRQARIVDETFAKAAVNKADRSAFIKAFWDEVEALGQSIRPAEKLFLGLSVPAVEELKRLTPEQVHELYRILARTHGSHCVTCHPEMASMPFAIGINAREYHRRQKARRRRKRKGLAGWPSGGSIRTT